MTTRRWLRAGMLAGLALAAYVLLPTSLGGTTTYVTTHGISMEPRFHTGDLAVLRAADDYGVGDVVGYRSATLHTIVMHRIVARRGDVFTLKGDNNDWLDPDHPGVGQIVGSLSFRIPNGGVWLERLSSPGGLLLIGLPTLVAGRSTARRRRNRRRAERVHADLDRPLVPHAPRPRPAPPLAAPALSAGPAVAHARRTPAPPASPLERLRAFVDRLPRVPSRLRGAALATAAAAVAAVLLGVVAFTSAPHRTVTRSVASPDQVTFGYTATVTRSAAYDSTVVHAPDPVFRRLAQHLDLTIRYEGVPATMTVRATLAVSGGWHTTVPLTGPVRADGTGAVAATALNLPLFEARARAAARAVGIADAGALAIAVSARFDAPGRAPFQAQAHFNVTPDQFTVGGDPTALTVRNSATVPSTGTAANTVGLLGFDLTVDGARRLSERLLLSALAAAAVLGSMTRRAAPESEATALAHRYRRLVVPVRHDVSPGLAVVHVESFAALVRMAERSERMVLHWATPGRDTFVVLDDNAAYTWRTPTTPRPGPLLEADAYAMSSRRSP